MREILFRGKREDNEWVYGDLVHSQIWKHLFTIIRVSNDGFEHYDEYGVIPETVGQYTGLTDKNGKKIFEGDIVKGSWKTIFEVYYDSCYLQFRAKIKGGYGKDIDYYGDSKKIEVIGNIHDNPELLEVEE